jgi:hypothetical protein
MTSVSLDKKLRGCALLFAAIVVLIGLISPSITLADGEGPSVAMTGTFAGHHYEIPAGSSVISPDICITVINDGAVPYNVNMTTVAPVGVNINLSKTEFSLNPGERQSISIEIQTTKDVAASNYTLSIKAAAYIANSGVVQVLPEVAEDAYLTITGDSARVSVTAVTPDGKPITAVVRLFKLIDERLNEVCYNESGHLEAIVAPGNFTAQAYVGGQLLDEKTFDVAANDNISISLQAGTIFIQSPSVIAYNDSKTGKLAYAQISYTLMNIYQKVDAVNVKLLVKFNGNQIDERDVLRPQPFDVGSRDESPDYTPASGWTNGVYGFTLELFVNNVSNGNSPEMPFEVKDAGAGGGSNNLALIIGIVCFAAILLIIAFYMVYKSRKRKNTKHKK